ncbi:MAG: glycerate kinase, partial [Planctomycetota bacterium]
MKRLLRDVFADVLRELDLRNAMGGEVGALLRAKVADGPLVVIAFGKGARAMAERLLHEVGRDRVRGLLVPPNGDDSALPPFEVLPGGHPLPTMGSLDAARRALELARGIGPHEHAVFLVSGGGSAMLELPGDPATSLDELRTLYGALVGSGAPIVAMNTVRRRFSAIKGGRLALAAAAAKSQTTLAISDVPDTDWAALASGPTAPEPSDDEACRAVLDRHGLWQALPARTVALW